ncbi:GTP-binding protein AARP2 involved in 40S ribosome biogenesis [Trachipleistophora hominis]|uniref:GTP-binding protein AARP2 involved in 40S ribosome biogenesis n=1 Tax=Trachipleistophora hominis TaxID=72359 RepID=L7JVB6_TRAHO|nr:GTP-binding protein AARP2 involved in 40S ribosome biogenesis [Trachipleistophora hominis]
MSTKVMKRKRSNKKDKKRKGNIKEKKKVIKGMYKNEPMDNNYDESSAKEGSIKESNAKEGPKTNNIRESNAKEGPKTKNIREGPNTKNIREGPNTKNIREGPKTNNIKDTILDLNPQVIQNMKYKDAAPSIVTLFGPPALLTDLQHQIISHLYKPCKNVQGPVTLRTSKTRRATFLKVSYNTMQMIDAAKIADLAVLVVNGTDGICKEHVEFITLLNAFGMPKVVVYVATRVDNKTLKHVKKVVWKEITPGIKVVTSVRMLLNCVAVFKSRPLSFKCENAYVVVDCVRVERDGMRMRGYVRGKRMMAGACFYVPGVGDVKVGGIVRVKDPCEIRSDEKVLERRKVFMYAPAVNDDEEGLHEDEDDRVRGLNQDEDGRVRGNDEGFVLYDGEKFEYDEEVEGNENVEDDEEVEGNENVEGNDERYENVEGNEHGSNNRCNSNFIPPTTSPIPPTTSPVNSPSTNPITKTNKLSFQELRKNALQKLTNNHNKKQNSTNPSTTNHPIQNVFIPGNYIEILVKTTFNHSPDSILIIAPIDYTAHALIKASFLRTKHFIHFVRSDDPIVVSAGWQRFITFPVFYRRLHGMNVYLRSSVDGCMACYYGPVCRGGVVMVRRVCEDGESNRDNNFFYNFRIVGTGRINGTISSGCDNIKDNVSGGDNKGKGSSRDNIRGSISGRDNIRGSISGKDNIKDNVSRDSKIISTPNTNPTLTTTPTNTISTTTTLNTNNDHLMYKKLKLIGNAYAIKGNTAFVRNMFNTNLEVNRFLHAGIKTTSGIRGIIKKALDKNGSFRASFEGEIVEGDTVILNTFVRMSVNELCYTVDEKVREVPKFRLRREINRDGGSRDGGISVEDKGISIKDSRSRGKDREVSIKDSRDKDSMSRDSRGRDSRGKDRKGSNNNKMSRDNNTISTTNTNITIPNRIINKLPLDKRLCYTNVVEHNNTVLSPFLKEDLVLEKEIKAKRKEMQRIAQQEKENEQRLRKEEEKERQRIKREGIIKHRIRNRR